jgi:predicted O-methyltransferase YrrM
MDRDHASVRPAAIALCASEDIREVSAFPEGPMKIAAFTMVYNEPVFLPIWRLYYGRAVGERNLFVLDHGSDDGSTEALGDVQRIRVPRGEYFDEDQRAAFVSKFQATLLSYYDAVIFADADEILIPEPAKFRGLCDFIEQRCPDFVNAVGLELYHLTDVEPDIDLTGPILAQRHYVRFAAANCKPLISRIPLAWEAGFHSCNYCPAIDPDLFLFHLKRMDQKLALAHLRKVRAIPLSENALRKQHDVQWRIDDQQFIRYLFGYSSETIRPLLTDDFDFTSDLARYRTDQPGLFQAYEGHFAAIPPRFKDLVPGGAPLPPETPAPAGEQAGVNAATATTHDRVFRALWGDHDPYGSFPYRRFRIDTQGWNSQHPYLRHSIVVKRPQVIVEVGVWKGGSVIHMAEAIRALALGSVIIAVDTWLGSADHWDNPEWKESLLFEHGYPTLFYTFLANVMAANLQDIVIPLPLDSQTASAVIKSRGIFPSMVHVDASHDYQSVSSDLRRWWALLETDGVMIVDDYDEAGRVWPEVRQAVRDFLKVAPHDGFEALPYKCRFIKR